MKNLIDIDMFEFVITMFVCLSKYMMNRIDRLIIALFILIARL